MALVSLTPCGRLWKKSWSLDYPVSSSTQLPSRGTPAVGNGHGHYGGQAAPTAAWVEQVSLHQIYLDLDLRKAYDALDRTRCLEILAGYGVGPNLLSKFASPPEKILARWWYAFLGAIMVSSLAPDAA